MSLSIFPDSLQGLLLFASHALLCSSAWYLHKNRPQATKTTPPQRLHSIQALLNEVDAFLFDCDGVIWKGDKAIERAAEVIAFLRKNNKRVFFFTNNSLKSRAGTLQKFKKLDIEASLEGSKNNWSLYLIHYICNLFIFYLFVMFFSLYFCGFCRYYFQ